MKKARALLLSALLTSAAAFPFFVSQADNGYVEDPVSYEGSAAVFTYEPYNQYVVYARVGYVTDIMLRPGEEVSKVAAGNTLQWAVEKDMVAGTSHIYIKPLSDSVTNVIINSNMRSYRILITTKIPQYFNPIVKWNFPNEDEADRLAAEARKTAAIEAAKNETIYAIHRAQNLYTNYKAVKNKNVLERYVPKSVFDDGKKTYIEITADNTQNMPVVYYYDDYDKDKLQLANYRLKGRFLEIDRVMNNIKLQYSQKSFLLIERVDKDEKVPSPKDIHFNEESAEQLSADSLAAGHRQQKDVEFHETPAVSLKEKMAEAARKRQLEAIRAAHPEAMNPSDDALDRLADVLQNEEPQSSDQSEEGSRR